ncbi:glycogen-binding subunit 76A [Calliphora vicina]|uniref:glycogen-binding subunit 76A n=1 Tax=Calliphora vicina TaxID=7373 RepID=UPI00325A70C9
MNGPGDLTVTHSSATPDPKNCSLVSIIPIVGMSSCRGRAEAFARRLSSKLRTLGTQADDADISPEDEPIINGGNTNTWVTGGDGGEQTVTDLQPLRHESDSFFDFDCELESPGSPVDECEYLRLIESASNTPHNSAAESGYACASAASSHSSSDGPYFDVNSENESCMSRLPHQHQAHQQTSNHICQPHQQTAKDEVDCAPNQTATGQCNGYQNHQDVTQTLPSEGPDIELVKNPENEIEPMENSNEIEMSKNVQELILQELHKQSQDYKEEEQVNNKRNTEDQDNKETEILTETETNTAKETAIHTELAPEEVQSETQQVVHITNGHAENGEDVLKVEVVEQEVIQNEVKEQESKHETDLKVDEPAITKDSKENELQIPKTENEKPKTSHLHMDATDDEDDSRPQRVRRCSSLKTGKTPPGTPGRKKIVRFADVLGLDLADIKTFLDEIPNIPKSAYEDLEILESQAPVQLGPKSDKLLMPLFQQPGGLPNYLDIVREKLVSLENAAVTDGINHTITGSVRVRNLDFHKSVHIRYSLDGWRSFADLQANYVENSCDGFSDKFTFIIFGNSLHIGQRLEFAVRFQCKGQQYWDNNYGSNYCFQCLPTSASVLNPIATVLPSHHSNNMVSLLSPTVGDTWCTSFY